MTEEVAGVTPLVMLSILPASPLPIFSQLEFLERVLEGAGTAPSASPLRVSTWVVSGSPQQYRCSHVQVLCPTTNPGVGALCVRWVIAPENCALGLITASESTGSTSGKQPISGQSLKAGRFPQCMGHTLFSSQLQISTGAGTRLLRTDVFLAQDKPSRDAHLNSQKGHVSAMEIHPGRLCALTGQAAG